ncbi:MAG: DUF294 nucleotidyltransferase-like domain-containing protein [Pseudomonadota bacterium]
MDIKTDQGLNKEAKFFASVIANLPEGIILCNANGKILLYNLQVNILLNLTKDNENFPFLGQPITSIIDKPLIDHTLDEINERLKTNVLDTMSYFVFTANQHTIQARVTPVLNSAGQFKGVVLILNDITRQNEIDKKIDAILHSLAENARSPIASIRAAIEAMKEFPDMEQAHQEKFKDIIYNESVVLSTILNDISDNYTSLTGTKKSIELIPAADLLETITRRSRETLNIEFNLSNIDKQIHVKADRYALTMVILFLLSQLKNETGNNEFFCSLSMSKAFVNIDIRWQGKPLKADAIKKWEDQYPDFAGQIFPMTLKETINTLHAAIWPFDTDQPDTMPYLRLFIPGEQKEAFNAARSMTILPEAQFDFYDPELFNKSGLEPELDNRLLTELNYTALIREITQAKNLKDIMSKQSQLPRLIHSMITNGTKTGTVTWLITTFSDAILEKVIKFALKEQGPAPVAFAFITLGSEGRQEQTLKTDQDNAIIFEDIPPGSGLSEKNVQNYFLELSKKICTWLDSAGYDFCLGGIMAKNPKWCQPLATWKNYFTKWIRTAEPENLLHTSIFFDFRFSHGSKTLVDELSVHLGQSIQKQPGFLRFMAQNALGFRPPIGFWGNFLVDTKGDHKKCLDIKTAMTPIVDFARIYSLKTGIKETNTRSRLYQLYIKRVLTRDNYNEIEQAYSFLLQIRFLRQINAIIGENIKPDNYINPKILSEIEQKMFKEVLKKIKLLQASLSQEFIGD